MDKKYPANSSDIDSYNQPAPAYSNGGEPSAPPAFPSVQYQQCQSIPMPSPSPSNAYQYLIRKRDVNDRHFPINAALFLLGLFIFPPLWFISIFWKSDNKYEKAWRKVNIVMSIILGILLVLIVMIFFIILAIDSKNGNKDPSWEIPDQASFILKFYSNY